MLVLCGLPVSNYYSKVKLALLEKGVPFEEERIGTAGVGAKADDALRDSPLGKIPFIRTDGGPLCESQAILEYIEAAYPEPPLLPKDPYAAAKVRELVTFVDLHVELVARELYWQGVLRRLARRARRRAGAKAPRAQRRRPRAPGPLRPLHRRRDVHPGRLRRLGVVRRDLDGDAWRSTARTCSSPAASTGSPTAKRLGERPSVQKVVADRKAAQDRAPAKG